MVNYHLGNPVGIDFTIRHNGAEISFRLPSKHEGVLAAMKNDKSVPNRLINEEQALRVSWRIIKEWVKAQMALVEADLALLPEIFLPFAITKTGNTLFEDFNNGNFMLPEPEHIT